MVELNIKNETSTLQSVVLGNPSSFGGVPTLENAYDPKSKEHIRAGTFPSEEDITREMDEFESVLKKYNVQVYRPENVEGLNQVYSRDIGFVVDDKFVVSNVLSNREHEIDGIDYLLDRIPSENIIRPGDDVRIEGGDIMPWNGHLFAGYSEEPDFSKYKVSRTNRAGVEFLKSTFPDYTVHAFELNKSDDDPMENALHLDCCFQPVGSNQAIIYEGGFKNNENFRFLEDYFGRENLIYIDKQQMYDMCSNVFSISQEVIVSEKGFSKLNGQLRERGFTVEEISYSEIAKMEGLLRCSTLPLKRN